MIAPPSLDDLLCLDFEASALGRCSYPIEVAVVSCATTRSQSWLIKPDAEWLHDGVWWVQSAKVHNISLEELMARGQSTAQVAQRG
jgi:hypothetical protein